MAKVFTLLFVILFSVYLTEQAYFLEENYIHKINERAKTWTVIYSTPIVYNINQFFLLIQY